MNKNKYQFTLNTEEMNDSHMGLAMRIKPKQSVLELGCSSGYLSKFLKEELDCTVVGVDIDSYSAEQAKPFCDKVIVADLDDDAWLAEIIDQQFDVVLCADVLEHLKKPIALLKSLKPFLHEESRLFASVPNIAHASVRLELLQGHFDYESLGILDDTHLHFYTRDGFISMLMQAGYVCCDILYSTHDLADEAIDEHLKNVGLVASETTRKLLHEPDAQAYQFIIDARPAKDEIVKHLPQPLTPKPLVSSGVSYSDKQATIVALREKVEGLEHNKSGLKQNVTDLEHNLVELEKLRAQEFEHNRNHQNNINQLNEALSNIKQQNNNEQEHNKNHLKAIQAWRETAASLDNTVFGLTDDVQVEKEKNNRLSAELSLSQEGITALQAQNTHYVNEIKRMESILACVHRKVSYRGIRWAKNTSKRVIDRVKKCVKNREEPCDLTQQENKNIDIAINEHDYNAWLTTYDNHTEKQLDSLRVEIALWKDAPKIAVLMPVYNPNRECLVNAIESVVQQVYENFELCIADDASTESYVKEVLSSYAEKDQRIKVVFREKNGHISAASNSALAIVEADYVALMDHDDLLTPDALFWVAKTICDNPKTELIYSDEDKMDMANNRYGPYFKPDWN
ncbi:MAG: glycosyltransferase, partial [Methylococcales bacterium]|nr:glycosyltransferase [Methylococcales bacterium]